MRAGTRVDRINSAIYITCHVWHVGARRIDYKNTLYSVVL
jgi:hypothetical protein